MHKQFYYLVGLGVGLVGLVLLQLPSARLKIVACDVGQGDAILLIKGSTQVLVDGGPSEEKILSCLGEQLPFWDQKLELIVMTNSDFDHMNGLSAVLERYMVMQFVTADGVQKSQGLERLVSAISKSGITVSAVEQGDVIRILGQDELQLEVLWPPEVEPQYVAMLSNQTNSEQREQILGASAKRGNLNERSVVLQILEDNKRILLMGDAGDQTEKQLVINGGLRRVDYLKVGHHGSKYASTLEFLELVRPKMAVISVGAKNRYGHPTAETLERLKQVGAEIKRTDELGTIVFE